MQIGTVPRAGSTGQQSPAVAEIGSHVVPTSHEAGTPGAQ
jgi:hypothetical protein